MTDAIRCVMMGLHRGSGFESTAKEFVAGLDRVGYGASGAKTREELTAKVKAIVLKESPWFPRMYLGGYCEKNCPQDIRGLL